METHEETCVGKTPEKGFHGWPIRFFQWPNENLAAIPEEDILSHGTRCRGYHQCLLSIGSALHITCSRFAFLVSVADPSRIAVERSVERPEISLKFSTPVRSLMP